jgi:UDP-N-acetylmuramoyl-tripeptide--D-alanyl-D-alanine ligase
VPDFGAEMVLSVTQGRLVKGPLPAVLRGVWTDTRALTAGALFVALRGERFDGHEFVAEAFRRGASAALVAREAAAAGPQIVVGDTLIALGALAAAHRTTLEVKVVAITGSTGKTTTKEMIAAILSCGWETARTPGNFNNEIGVPLALLELGQSHRAAVVELAMRGRGQIAYLAEMVRPQVGVITNIGLSHLELLGSREAIAETKAELLEALPTDGAAVLNADDDFFAYLRGRSQARVISFGRSETADVRVENVKISGEGEVSLRLRGWWGEEEVSLRAAGRHQGLNAAAAAAAAMASGAERGWLAQGLSAFEAADMRGQIDRAPGGYTVINDCYNAAPDSMRVALELLVDLPGKRKWAVLGDMKELGPLSADWHREVGRLVAEMPIAFLVTVGELGHYIAGGARAAGSRLEVKEAADNAGAAELVREGVAPGDVVLVKGSRVMKMEAIVTALLGSTRESADGR